MFNSKKLNSSSVSLNNDQKKIAADTKPLPGVSNTSEANKEGINPNVHLGFKTIFEDQAKKCLQSVKTDIEILEMLENNIPQFSSALMRLSIQRNPVARDKALQLLRSQNKRLSMIAFRSLGYFDEGNVNLELQKLTKSSNQDLRRSAMQALAWNPQLQSGRQEILEDYLKSTKKVLDIANRPGPSAEKHMAVFTLLQMDSKNLVALDLMKKLDKSRENKKKDLKQ